MLFTSGVFLFKFLPVVLIGFYLFARFKSQRGATAWLLVSSLFFYAWWEPINLALLIGSYAFNYRVGEALRNNRSKGLLIFGIAANLCLLGYYKYTNFLLGTAFGLGVIDRPVHFDIVLPLAISFYTFQQIAYIVDVYSGKSTAPNLAQYSLFLAFFPHAIAGPIIHHQDVVPQFKSDRFPNWQWRNLLLGLVIFTIGFDKKVLVADSFAPFANAVFAAGAMPAPTILEAWVGTLAYTFQIYFDFSGYSDMAIGLAVMVGIKLPINFNSPYKATNIIDFWRMWHMTLSRFLRDYLYYPLGGNRQGVARRYLNLAIVMFLGGLWHGAGWTYAIWGILHGFYLVVNHGWRAAGFRMPPALGRAVCFVAVVVAWIFFRAESLDGALAVLRAMFGFGAWGGIVDGPLNEIIVLSMGEAFAPHGDVIAVGFCAAAILFVWLLPNTQELTGSFRPALNYTPPAAAQALSERLARRWKPICLTFFLVSASIAGLVATARGAISTEFIYMIF